MENYSELQTAIANRIDRSDLTADIPTFITLGEARINRNPDLRGQETLAYADLTSDRYLTLPPGFVEMFNLRIKEQAQADTDYQALKQTPADRIDSFYSASARPTRFCVRDQLEVNAVPDQAYRVMMHYSKQWDIATDNTNWLLTHHPDVYFYSALAEAANHMKFYEDEDRWNNKFEAALSAAILVDLRSRDNVELDTSEYANVFIASRYSFDVSRGH